MCRLCNFAFWILLGSALGLSACAPTLVPGPTLAPTFTPVPSETLRPIPPSPTAKATVTPELPAFGTPTPGIDPTAEWLDILLPDCAERSSSPDGKWAAGAGCYGGYAQVVRSDRRLRWFVPHTYFYPDPVVATQPYAPLFWTPDGRYLFMKITTRQSDSSAIFVDGQGLMRLDLNTGAESMILKPSQGIDYSISFSADGSQLGYVLYGEGPLIAYLVDQETGKKESFKIPTPFTAAGRFVWSPDNRRVVFAQEAVDAGQKMYSIGLYERSTSSVRTLIPEQDAELIPSVWLDEMRIQFEDSDGTCSIFDLSAGAFTDEVCQADEK